MTEGAPTVSGQGSAEPHCPAKKQRPGWIGLDPAT